MLGEFATSLERILADTKEDIYTEVGISFLLAGEEDHPTVMRLRDALVGAYDPEARMVPSREGRHRPGLRGAPQRAGHHAAGLDKTSICRTYALVYEMF